MANNEQSDFDSSDRPTTSGEHRNARHMRIGTLVRLALEGVDADLQRYSVRASVTTKPITHATRLELLSSEPPLPDHILDESNRAFIDSNPVPVNHVVNLKGRLGSDLGMSVRILSIAEEQQ